MATNAKIIFTEVTKVQDGAVTEAVIERKLTNKELEISEYIDRLIAVAKDDSDVQVEFGGLSTGKWIRLETNQPVYVKIDDTGSTARKVTTLLIWHGEISALYLSGDGTNDAVVKIFIGGE